MYASKSFYITLPSNVKSLAGHHKNLTSEYTTYLPKALELNTDDWECALVEISYPHSYDNMHPPFDTVKYTYEDPHTKKKAHHIATIANSYYDSIEQIVEAVNDSKPRGFKGFLAFEKKGRKKTKIVLHPNEGLKFHVTLARLLGFKAHQWSYNPLEVSADTSGERMRIKADFIADVRTLHYNLYVYSNVVQPHLCGTEYLPLLRTVNVEGTEGSYISRVYEIPHYLPLASNFIESIDVKIADDLGQNVRFMYGKLIIKLHFRRRSFLHQ